MDLFQFFARFHVLVLHLPIGILMLAALLEMHHLYSNKPKAVRSVLLNTVWFWGAFSAVAACILGWMLSQADGYNPEAVFIHRTFGIILAVTAFVCWIYFKQTNTGVYANGASNNASSSQPAIKTSTKHKWFGGLLASSQLFLLFATGHYGANMTHGETYLVEYAPNPIRVIAGLPPHAKERPPISALHEALVFEDLIQPTLSKTCSSCHNDSKQKGGLNLAHMQGILAGGKSGDAIVAGDLSQSELYTRITLDHEDKEFMPAEGKKAFTADQVALMAWWINNGAPFEGTVDEFVTNKDDSALLHNILGLGEVLFDSIAAVSEQQIQGLHRAGFVVKHIAKDMNYLDLDLSVSRAEIKQSAKDLISSVAQNVAYLNLSKTPISEAVTTSLGQFINLQRLRMDNSNVTSEDLQLLHQLTKLSYLNLYGTQVDDQIFDVLSQMPALEQVYLGASNVSQEKIEAFKQNSNVQVFWQGMASVNESTKPDSPLASATTNQTAE